MKARLICAFIAVFGGITVCAANAKNLIDASNKLQTEASNEIHHITKFYQKIQEDETALANLKNVIRHKLREKNSQFLANILCGGASTKNKQKLKELTDLYAKHYESQLVDDIVKNALTEGKACRTFDQLLHVMWQLCQEGEQNLFELLVRSHVHLYQILSVQNSLKLSKDLMKLAYSLYKIKEHTNFQLLQDPLKENVHELIERFPNNIKYLVFYDHFCLMNVKYSEYIYTAMSSRNLDATSRYVWVWFDKLSIDDTGHIKANIMAYNFGNSTELGIQLVGTKYNIPYYMMPDSKLIAAWDMPLEPVNSWWTIEFIDNEQVAFSQPSGLMCSTDERTDQERRLVRGYTAQSYTSKSDECKWLLGSCKRN